MAIIVCWDGFFVYHAGGGEGGIGAFLEKLAPTIKDVWAQLGNLEIRTEEEKKKSIGEDGEEDDWRGLVVRQTEEAYGPSTSAESREKMDLMLRGVIGLQKKYS